MAELRRRRDAIWPGGTVDRPRVLDYVSHPSTFAAGERAHVAEIFAPLGMALAEGGLGPVRFVTLADLARLWG